ncbi:MAG: hypothetical protein ACRDG3_12705 [Tepidiformaceae bacterium]
MTKLLEQALAEASRLSPGEPDAIAALMLEELALERRWQRSFVTSQDVLDRLYDEADADIKAGRIRPLDPEAM